jgi:hypothetical protein
MIIKRFIQIVSLCMALNHSILAIAMSGPNEDYELAKENFELYQMWALSRNYYFGATLTKNLVEALAWQYVYLNSLPHNYPGKTKIIAPYKKGLTSQQLKKAKVLSKLYQNKYKLNFEVNEKQLQRLLDINKQSMLENKPPKLANFKELLQYLWSEKNYSLVEELQIETEQLVKNKRFPIIFGQIVIEGPEPAEMVSSNIQIHRHGIFIAHVKNAKVFFKLAGYKSQSITINKKNEVINFGQIVLSPITNKQKTGIVGRVTPWPGIEKGNILLRIKPEDKESNNNPWHNPVIPLTVLNNGKFYATGLSPDKYQLIINIGDKKVIREFRVSANQIRGIPVIDMLRYS